MRVDELLTNEVIERFRLRKETPQERDTLVSLASKALCRKIFYTCRNCYFDALMELVNLYKTNRILFEERMKEKKISDCPRCVYASWLWFQSYDRVPELYG